MRSVGDRFLFILVLVPASLFSVFVFKGNKNAGRALLTAKPFDVNITLLPAASLPTLRAIQADYRRRLPRWNYQNH